MNSPNQTLYRCDVCGEYTIGTFYNHKTHTCGYCQFSIQTSVHDKKPYKETKIDTTKADKFTKENNT